MTGIDKAALLREIKTRAATQSRFVVAISGPPGSGKSTLAKDLAEDLGPSAAVLPMDGFHLDNVRLEQLGLLHRKGAPETFDAEGFVALVRNLRNGRSLRFPTFDREADRTVPDAGSIDQDTRIVLVEGNYLLLNTPAWSDLAGLFDLTVKLRISRDELETRLTERWLDHGLPPEEARARALGNDMVNADYVERNSFDADFTLETDTDAKPLKDA